MLHWWKHRRAPILFTQSLLSLMLFHTFVLHMYVLSPYLSK